MGIFAPFGTSLSSSYSSTRRRRRFRRKSDEVARSANKHSESKIENVVESETIYQTK